MQDLMHVKWKLKEIIQIGETIRKCYRKVVFLSMQEDTKLAQENGRRSRRGRRGKILFITSFVVLFVLFLNQSVNLFDQWLLFHTDLINTSSATLSYLPFVSLGGSLIAQSFLTAFDKRRLTKNLKLIKMDTRSYLATLSEKAIGQISLYQGFVVSTQKQSEDRTFMKQGKIKKVRLSRFF